ncbi:MAG: hypothetical protein AAFY76_08520 [Cyanobacteria bacterium J06649_11]
MVNLSVIIFKNPASPVPIAPDAILLLFPIFTSSEALRIISPASLSFVVVEISLLSTIIEAALKLILPNGKKFPLLLSLDSLLTAVPSSMEIIPPLIREMLPLDDVDELARI